MASSELDLMKEIPGYKLILKTVLKGQIQQLVQQLALYTDEESVLLTACVGDGAVTVSSLGSDIGKMFLGDHEDIKSQFISFCLKNHHNIPLQKDESTIDNDPYFGPCNLPLSPKVVSPKQGGVLTRSSPKQRHEPYPVKRSSSRQAFNIEKSARLTEGKMVSIKQENSSTGPNDSISNVEIGNPESVESLTGPREQCDQSEKKGEIFENQFAYQNEATFQREAEKDNSDNSNTSSPENSKTVPVTPESLFVNSCFTSSLPLDTAQRENRSQSACNSDIKLEAISESEMELEITGTMPGNGNAKGKKSLSLADVTLSPKSAGATSGYEDLARQVPQISEPTFTASYPVTVLKDEGSATPGGTELHEFEAQDAETGVIPFLDFTYDPTSGADMFEITETVTATARKAVVTLKPNEEFDYETLDTYKIYAKASDGTNTATGLLTIQVRDVGEAPTMNPNTTEQYFTIEENAAGTVIGSPSFTIQDLDNIDVHTWAITGGNGSSYISINTNNGTITLKTNYDRDDASLSEGLYVDVSITDKYSLSVTTIYYITITDRNDNIPICSPKIYNFNVTRTTAIGTVLATLACTDADISSPNNEITYSFITNDATSNYFNISGSDIVLSYLMDLEYGGGPYTVFVNAADGGSIPTTSTVTLTFTIPEATTLPPTTTNVPNPGYDALSSDDSLTVFLIIAAFVAACILGYVLILCWRWNTFGKCLPSKCPDRHDCATCCVCCPGDDIEKNSIIDNELPNIGNKKGLPLGFEAPNSRRKPIY
ncbi:uncharacterized protein LOC132723562 [Ruditapes philippinarum]|uniref:uncharacterized protein LOC132723562 n=1 Tax=Ruditapes philippinarum TaxID=129788 RepID=UPI00295BCC62|nr:uncharacterized protein LOC132723562 [Ruditapes philippinarum]XP_060564283.1 uncharacterized protein LOC132723562 [Ruditapes philippinarum]